MNNHDFLHWMADRLVAVYGESEGTDFVTRLREIAAQSVPPEPAPSTEPRLFRITATTGNDLEAYFRADNADELHEAMHNGEIDGAIMTINEGSAWWEWGSVEPVDPEDLAPGTKIHELGTNDVVERLYLPGTVFIVRGSHGFLVVNKKTGDVLHYETDGYVPANEGYHDILKFDLEQTMKYSGNQIDRIGECDILGTAYWSSNDGYVGVNHDWLAGKLSKAGPTI